MGFKPLTDAVTAKEFLRRPEVSYARCGMNLLVLQLKI